MTDDSGTPADDDRERAWASLGPRFGPGYDEVFARLVAAAAPTALRRFYPFTSLTRLCFAETGAPFKGLQHAYISFSQRGEFFACRGLPYGDVGAVTVETDDPHEAVAEVLKLLRLAQ